MIDAYLKKRLKGGAGGEIQLPGCTITIRPFDGAGGNTPTSYIININVHSPYEENTSPKFVYYTTDIQDGPTSYHADYTYLRDVNLFNTHYPDFAKKFNKIMANASFDGFSSNTSASVRDLRFLAMIDGASNLNTQTHFQRYWDYVVNGSSGDPTDIYTDLSALDVARTKNFQPIIGMQPNQKRGSSTYRYNPTTQIYDYNTPDVLGFHCKTATFMGIIGASHSDYMTDKIYRLRCYDRYDQLMRIGLGQISPMSRITNPWFTSYITDNSNLKYYSSKITQAPSSVNIQSDSLALLMRSWYMNNFYGGYSDATHPDVGPVPKYRRQVMYLTGIELADPDAPTDYEHDDDFISAAFDDFTIELFNVLMSWLYVGLINNHLTDDNLKRPKNKVENLTLFSPQVEEGLYPVA